MITCGHRANGFWNAIAHRDYNSTGSVEVWLFKDRLEVKNPGKLPIELNVKKLEQDHGSYPYNPRLAEILYQAGYIERFGTGTGEIFRLTEKAGLKNPGFDLSEGVKIIIWRPSVESDHDTVHDTTHDTVHDTTHDGRKTFREISDLTHRIVMVIKGEMSRNEIMNLLDLKNRSHFAKNYLEPALSNKIIEMILPDKPKRKKQKYRLTRKGKTLKERLTNGN